MGDDVIQRRKFIWTAARRWYVQNGRKYQAKSWSESVHISCANLMRSETALGLHLIGGVWTVRTIRIEFRFACAEVDLVGTRALGYEFTPNVQCRGDWWAVMNQLISQTTLNSDQKWNYGSLIPRRNSRTHAQCHWIDEDPTNYAAIILLIILCYGGTYAGF